MRFAHHSTIIKGFQLVTVGKKKRVFDANFIAQLAHPTGAAKRSLKYSYPLKIS
ncbi:MAG: hypothetical protein WBG70_23130 [Spirulinaceae cyanobacterium]